MNKIDLYEGTSSFTKDLENLVNKYSIDSLTGVPDYILADLIFRYIEMLEQVKEENEDRIDSKGLVWVL